jgi:hypothetical protein
MSRLAVLATLSSLLFVVAAAAQTPDTVLLNGKIVTLDARSSVAQALAIGNGRVTAVGRPMMCESWQAPRRASSICADARSSPGSSIRTCTPFVRH